ncbi:MAG TPA: efflux RND transporter permease subunit [Gemmatimonadaceae bacterium]|nr:efflux RND transporter permease subunit [Gemmatimonadaceae bacterium]
MIRKIVRFALRQRLLVIGATVLVALIGLRAFDDLDVEAFPDVEDVHVQVITEWPGHAAEEIERLVTLPIERQLNGAPNLSNIRSISMLGLSTVTMTFEDGTADYFARQQTLERLQGVPVPPNVTPQLGSLSNSTSEVYRYTIRGNLPLTELKALEDWTIEPAIRTVSGIADIVSFGGEVKQYQVDIDPVRLRGYGLTLAQVEQAIAAANANAGGGYISHGYEKQVVRGVGIFKSVDDIANVALVTRNGVPVRVEDVGEAHIGGAPREGIVAKDSADDVVEGIVLMRKGGNAVKVLAPLRDKITELNTSVMPKEVTIVPFYDRETLVRHTVRTVEENLATGAFLVLVILVAFLGSWRSAVIVGLVIPLSLLFAFILMDVQGVSANLISLGAIDFGIIVDAAVVMVEAFLVRLVLTPPPTADELRHTVQIEAPVAPMTPAGAEPNETATFEDRRHDFDLRASVEKRHLLATIAEAMGRPIMFAKAIVIVAFLPIFTFQRVEKRIFSPMAFTLTFALVGSLILSLTLVPVLSSFWLTPEQGKHEPPAARWLQRHFMPLLDWVLGNKRVTMVSALAALGVCLLIGAHLGTEFLPELDEGNIWLRVTMPVGISLDQAKIVERQVRAVLLGYPEIRQVVTQLGRPDDGTDTKGSNNLEIYADLRPRNEWKSAHDKDALIALMETKLDRIPGIELNFSQYIKDNVEEALSGVTGELVIKIFGPDLAVLQQKAVEVERVIAGVHGAADVGVEQQFGQPQLRVEFDRAAMGRQGVAVADAADALETAVGGRPVTQFFDGDRAFDVRVRFIPESRDNRQAIEHLDIAASDGHLVPLSTLGEVVSSEGASRISRESNERRIAVKCSVRGRDQGGFVDEAQSLVAKRVSLPSGYRMTWGGQFENQRRATKRLAVIVPASIVLIFILLFSAFSSVKYASLILANLPFALIGGILTLWVRGINLSVSAAVGFIALFGISVQNGVILVTEFNRLRDDGLPLLEAVRRGTSDRLRPVVMTALMAALGLLPAALSRGIGAETTRPFASVIVGGLLTATVLTLFILPLLYVAFHEVPHAEVPR